MTKTLKIPPETEFANDTLRGGTEIAEFLFGDPGQRRKVYHLAENSKIPIFRLGSVLCARRSVLMAWVKQQEGRGWPLRSEDDHPVLDYASGAPLSHAQLPFDDE